MSDMIAAYAAYSKDDKARFESSSGAVFSLLAEQVLHRNGVVYGVAMSLDCQYAEFVRVDHRKDLAKLRGSKYLQARLGKTLQRVKLDLESGFAVLFSGTGCQINGLKRFLGKEYSNLYCVDVICHGVPSPKLWREYVQYNEDRQKAKLVGVNFRCKDDSWADFGMKRIDAKHKVMYVPKDKDPFMLMFLSNYCLRPSCYECAAKGSKLSDLTIADFWGIDKVVSGMNDGKGVSLVITRSNRGQRMLDEIIERVKIQQVTYEDGVRQNRADYSSADRPKERDRFFKDMNTLSFDELKVKYGAPEPISQKRKVKNAIKKILMRTPASKFIGKGAYGLRFTFEEKVAGKERCLAHLNDGG